LKYYRRVVQTYGLNVRQFEEVVRVEQFESHAFRAHTPAGAYDGRNLVISTGYYDNPNLMGIPGEELPHVSHYYTEPHPSFNHDVVVIGGKNSAAEAALDLFRSGARVSLVHRGPEMGNTVKYWVRPDIENRFKAREITPYFNARVLEITPGNVRILQDQRTLEIPAQRVFALTGYHTDTRFFDQLGVTYDKNTLRPQVDSATFETNVPGVYVAGSVMGGRINSEIFIENGRLHGEVLVKAIRNSRRETRPAGY
jgi:thioredoxin reductase (NADPH)